MKEPRAESPRRQAAGHKACSRRASSAYSGCGQPRTTDLAMTGAFFVAGAGTGRHICNRGAAAKYRGGTHGAERSRWHRRQSNPADRPAEADSHNALKRKPQRQRGCRTTPGGCDRMGRPMSAHHETTRGSRSRPARSGRGRARTAALPRPRPEPQAVPASFSWRRRPSRPPRPRT